jgi:hypothetical protein
MPDTLKLPAYNLLTIRPVPPNPYYGEKDNKVFQAYIQDEVGFGLNMMYDTLFGNMLNWRGFLNQLLAGGSMLLSQIGAVPGEVEKHMYKILTQGISWTRKFGGMPEHIQFGLRCMLVSEESTEDIKRALQTLYDITVPKVSPAISWVSQMVVEVSIGGWLIFDQCFVDRIGHRFSKVSVDGVPLSCEVDLSITTVYAVGRDQIASGNQTIIRVGEVGARMSE